MRNRLALGAAFVVALVVGFTFSGLALQGPGPVRTYTISWEHDGVNTDSYTVTVDGTPVSVITTCGGTPRTCSGPLPMTTNVTHTIVVKAVGTFGDSASVPFVAAPPATPGAVRIR